MFRRRYCVALPKQQVQLIPPCHKPWYKNISNLQETKDNSKLKAYLAEKAFLTTKEKTENYSFLPLGLLIRHPSFVAEEVNLIGPDAASLIAPFKVLLKPIRSFTFHDN